MSTGNLVIDPTFIAPQDWCDGATTWPAGVSVEDSSIFVAAYGAVSLAFYPPASGGEIVVGAGQIAVGNVLAFSGYIFPMSTLLAGHPYFGLLDYNGTLLVDALPNSTGLAAGTYTVAAGVTSIRPVFNFNGCEFAPALPSRLGWSAGHAYAVGAQIDPANGYVYQCIVAGTSGSSQPTWPTPAGWLPGSPNPIPLTVVADGSSCVWSCVAWQGSTMALSNPYIAVL
ncbi:MAG: hypothetical protein WAL35_03175 [Acidimicrobiales bacterium]